jgi:hypothetical protein
MKTMKQTLVWLTAAVLALSLVSSAEAQNAQRTGKVVRIKGEARYSTGNKVWQPLKVGTVLKSGYIVQTALNSYADVVINEEASAAPVMMPTATSTAAPARSGAGGGGGAAAAPDQDVVRLLDDTYVVFDNLTAVDTGADRVTETMIDLKKGSIFGTVKKQAAASRFEIKIPNGVAGIRGTIFLISANGNIACLTGSVVAAFTNPAGEVATQVVGAGQQFNIGSGAGGEMGAATRSSMSQAANEFAQSSPPGLGLGRGKGKGNAYGHDKDHVSPNGPKNPVTPPGPPPS